MQTHLLSLAKTHTHMAQMALRVFLLAPLLFFCALQVSSYSGIDDDQLPVPNRRLFTDVDCEGLCQVRCANARPNVCTRACETCCARCGCVPPGTYGNREDCGQCYTAMTTDGNNPKCP